MHKFKGTAEFFQTPTFVGNRNTAIAFIAKDKYITLFTLLWFVPIVFSIIFIYLNLPSLPYQIPLFYSKIWGEAQLGDKNYIYLPVLGVFLLGLVNFLISFLLNKQDKLFTYLLLASGAIISVLSAITIFNIIRLIG